jgi:hypothetical protein
MADLAAIRGLGGATDDTRMRTAAQLCIWLELVPLDGGLSRERRDRGGNPRVRDQRPIRGVVLRGGN